MGPAFVACSGFPPGGSNIVPLEGIRVEWLLCPDPLPWIVPQPGALCKEPHLHGRVGGWKGVAIVLQFLPAFLLLRTHWVWQLIPEGEEKKGKGGDQCQLSKINAFCPSPPKKQSIYSPPSLKLSEQKDTQRLQEAGQKLQRKAAPLQPLPKNYFSLHRRRLDCFHTHPKHQKKWVFSTELCLS